MTTSDKAHTGPIAHVERVLDETAWSIVIDLHPTVMASIVGDVLAAVKRDGGSLGTVLAAVNADPGARHELMTRVMSHIEDAPSRPLRIVLHPDEAQRLSDDLYRAAEHEPSICPDCDRLVEVDGEKCGMCHYVRRIGA